MKVFVHSEGQQCGPFYSSFVAQEVLSGSLSYEAKYFVEGGSSWEPIQTLIDRYRSERASGLNSWADVNIPVGIQVKFGIRSKLIVVGLLLGVIPVAVILYFVGSSIFNSTWQRQVICFGGMFFIVVLPFVLGFTQVLVNIAKPSTIQRFDAGGITTKNGKHYPWSCLDQVEHVFISLRSGLPRRTKHSSCELAFGSKSAHFPLYGTMNRDEILHLIDSIPVRHVKVAPWDEGGELRSEPEWL